MTTPDLTAKVLGFRRFSLEGNPYLGSVGVSSTWEPGVNTAACKYLSGEIVAFRWGPETPQEAPQTHTAPCHECECGLYAMHSLYHVGQYTIRNQETVLGAVLSWGKLESHYAGFRAEHSQIVLLAPEQRAQPRKILVETAMRYGVKIVPAVALEREAARFGRGMPESLIPDDPGPTTLGGYLIPPSWIPPIRIGGPQRIEIGAVSEGGGLSIETSLAPMWSQIGISAQEASKSMRNAIQAMTPKPSEETDGG